MSNLKDFVIKNGELKAYTGVGGNVIIPEGVTSIGDFAFRGRYKLKNLTIPNGVNHIGINAFQQCDKLLSITLPDSVISIGDFAFSYCRNLKNITIPDGVTSIGSSVFYECGKLTSVIIPDGVTSIGSSAFNGCSSLKSITIPNSVASIGEGVFSRCSKLTNIIVSENNTSYRSIDGNLYSKDETKLIQYAIGKTATTFSIPNSVTSIANHAFSGCNRLTDITIPDGVTSIASSAFSGCSSLKKITIPDGVTSIDEGVFSGCNSLTNITIPDGVTSIGVSAFSGCSKLTSIIIPDRVTSIGKFAFYNCYKLVEVVNKAHITVKKGMTTNGYIGYHALAVYNSEDTFTGTKISNDNGYIIYTDGDKKILLGYTSAETTLVLPSYITSISNYAFFNCSSLTSVTIPDSVTTIGNYAFSNCDGLTSVTIPDSVTSIGDSAFYRCGSLTSVTIPDSVTSIGSSVFNGCNGLIEITLPFLGAMKNEINHQHLGHLFGANSHSSNCSYVPISLKKVTITSAMSIGDFAFSGCSSLTSITIPDSVTRIGDSAFWGCNGLTNIEIPSSVASICEKSFADCKKLKRVVIRDKIPDIAPTAFEGCNKINEIVAPNDSIADVMLCGFEIALINGFMGLVLNDKDIPQNVIDGGNEYIRKHGMFIASDYWDNMDVIVYVTQNKLLSIKVADVILDKAMENGNAELTATMLSYKDNFIGNDTIGAAFLDSLTLEDEPRENAVDGYPFAGLIFVVTGALESFPQINADGFPDRTELKRYIERRGGRLANSVTQKTNYLITNTPNSGTKKNRDAQALGVKIITEEEFFALEQ